MCFLTQVIAAGLLLSLTAAAPTPECECECAHLNKTLSAEELDTIFGKWILHESYLSTNDDNFKLNITHPNNSKAELIRTGNNQTVILKQAIMVNEMCIRYSINFTIVGNTIQSMSPTTNGSSESDFLKTCDGCLMMRNKIVTCDGTKATFLFFFKNSVTLSQADQETARKQAKCLGFLQPPEFIYKQTEFCPEESDVTTTKEPEQS